MGLREALATSSDYTSTIADAEDLSISELIKPFTSPEGLFLPETYLIPRGMTDLDVLRTRKRGNGARTGSRLELAS